MGERRRQFIRFDLRRREGGYFSIKIYVADPLGPVEREAFGRLTPGDEVWMAGGGAPTEKDRGAFLEAEVAYGAIPVEWLLEARRLRWIQFTSVGLERYLGIDWAGMGGRVVCTSAGGIYADAMAQTVLGGILALYRELDTLVRLQLARDWQKPDLHPRLRVLAGATVLLLGAGSVNRRLRDLLLPFDCSFTAFDRTSGDIHTPAELDRELAHSDLVCAAMPDSPATRGLVSAERIARFKPGAIFTNVGRGTLVDEPALVAALRAGRLAGAVIDVTWREPLPPDDPLWSCPHTILTQHTSAGSTRVSLDPILFFGENLARYRAAKPLQRVIDWSKGY